MTARHQFERLHDHRLPECLRQFLFYHSLPAIEQLLVITKPQLFAMHGNTCVRVTMASRLGDVGITGQLDAEYGYSERVMIEELDRFSSETPPPNLTSEEHDKAEAEGWYLSSCYGTEDGRRFAIERVDETAVFASDFEAWRHVNSAHTPHAHKALAFLKYWEPKEYERVVSCSS